MKDLHQQQELIITKLISETNLKKERVLIGIVKEATGLEINEETGKLITLCKYEGKPEYEEYYFKFQTPEEIFLMSFDLEYPVISFDRPYVPQMVFKSHFNIEKYL